MLRTSWQQALVDDPPGEETPETFATALRSFIASHATSEDRHELVQQLRTPKKPLKMSVQQFAYRMQELNSGSLVQPMLSLMSN